MQDEGQFQNYCFDIQRFMLHVSIDEDSVDDIPKFKKCSKCNRPTLDHRKPVHGKCTQAEIDDIDDIFDIEDMLQEREEFKEAFTKLIETESSYLSYSRKKYKHNGNIGNNN